MSQDHDHDGVISRVVIVGGSIVGVGTISLAVRWPDGGWPHGHRFPGRRCLDPLSRPRSSTLPRPP